MKIDGNHFRDITCNCWDPQKRLEECDDTQVRVQVLSTIPVLFNYWAKPDDCLVVSKLLNDDLAKVVASKPDRFVGLGTVPMQSPELAIQEMKRCVFELGFAGIQIGSHINDWNLDASELDPFWKACNDLEIPVFIHPWDMQQDGRMKKYWFPWLIGMPCETTIVIVVETSIDIYRLFARLFLVGFWSDIQSCVFALRMGLDLFHLRSVELSMDFNAVRIS